MNHMQPRIAFGFCLALAALVSAQCGSFENPAVVLDLRALAITAEPPEQVLDINPQAPSLDALLDQLVPTKICALVADPSREAPIDWRMRVCVGNNDERCATTRAYIELGAGQIAAPHTITPAPALCAELPPSGALAALLFEAVQGDALSSLGGVELTVELAFATSGEFASAPQYASKKLVYAPRIPADRVANRNPELTAIHYAIAAKADAPWSPAQRLPLTRCADVDATVTGMPQLAVGNRMRLTPEEAPNMRERYGIPTLSGDVRTFTESPTYQWLTTAGGFTKRSTGGTRDAFGNPATLFTDFKTPSADEIPANGLASLWVVVRDERRGATWYETCVRIAP